AVKTALVLAPATAASWMGWNAFAPAEGFTMLGLFSSNSFFSRVNLLFQNCFEISASDGPVVVMPSHPSGIEAEAQPSAHFSSSPRPRNSLFVPESPDSPLGSRVSLDRRGRVFEPVPCHGSPATCSG